MRMFSRALCALPLVAALFATPAAAIGIFISPNTFLLNGLVGEAGSGPYYFGAVAPDGTVSLSIATTDMERMAYNVRYSGGWSDIASGKLTYDGVTHVTGYNPDGSVDYSYDKLLQGSYDLLASDLPSWPGNGHDVIVPFMIPWNVDERFADGMLKHTERSTMNFKLDLVFNEGAVGEKFFFGVGAVPEPQTWALMITGFGLAGVALRRSRRQGLTA